VRARILGADPSDGNQAHFTAESQEQIGNSECIS
jgi:hypothetical protein